MKHSTKIGKSTPSLKFFITLAKVEAKISRYFESSLSGISFTEFMVLHFLRESSERKLRRVDLAKKLGITAQGITRLITLMEKKGLVTGDTDKLDRRVSCVVLTVKGTVKFIEVLEQAEVIARSMLPYPFAESVEKVSLFLNKVSATIANSPVR